MQGLRPTRTVVGLDPGAGAVKAVELAGGRLRSYGFALCSEQGENDGHSTRDAIRRALAQAAPRARRAVVGLDADDCIVHRFSLPKELPAAEIDEQASLQAQQAAPYPLSEAFYDYLEETAADHSLGYLMVIARSASVLALCRAVEGAGLRVAAVDVTPFAVNRSLPLVQEQPSTLAVLDGAQRQCRLTVYSDGEAVFRHSQPFGCGNLLERLRASFGLSEDDARRALGECALPGGAVARIREPFLKDLARHAARAMRLYSTSRPDAPVPARLLLRGGAALVYGACRALRDELEMAVSVLEFPAASANDSKASGFSPVLFGAYALARNDHV